jgi:hypothetical protein
VSDLTNPNPAGGEDYAALLAAIRQIAGEARVRAAVSSHVVRLTMYWNIGREILTRQEAQGTGSRGYGARIIARLAADIAADPALKSIGASRRNLQYMRKFAAAWPDWEKMQPAVALSSWKHQTILLDRLDEPDLRLRYAGRPRSMQRSSTARSVSRSTGTGRRSAWCSAATTTKPLRRLP